TYFTCTYIILKYIISAIRNTFANTIQPLYSEKHVVRGENVILSCNYTGNWYRQYPGSRPEYLIFNAETGVSSEHTLRLKAQAKKEITEVELEISSTEVKDSAVYYCALRPTVTGNPPALYRNLIH
uniref:T-cell receptor alpha/delta variable 8.0 n=1 Tax=Cyprinus carpio TaxID=7962 RepID=A0A8C1S2U0_CYPCA